VFLHQLVTMGLFQQLLKLHHNNVPLEDFFTEIVAHLFSTNYALLLDWLKYTDVFQASDYLGSGVTTQKVFQHPIRGDEKRPDIVIELTSPDAYDIIFIESKVGSQEGYNQLSDYAEILDSLSGYRHRCLLYITRDFDPKEKDCVLKHIPNSEVSFTQLRWHQLYLFLNNLQSQSDLIKEIIQFMQEHRMAQNNQFSAIDVLSLANFQSPLKLMEQTMWGKTVQKFEEVLDTHKNIKFRRQRALQNIQWFGRYIMYASMPGKWGCHLGFLFRPKNNYNPYDYSVVRLVLEIDPKSPHFKSTIQTFEKICEHFDWRGYSLHEPGTWSHIALEKSLRDFLVEDDHVVAIENFFLEALGELQTIKNQYPQLPWGAISEDDEDSEEA
jgi:hypothetical protein